ncbi:uncharacterized protein LOC112190073 isoform X2 [Rosa chinensis]|nr:uncharacterized protein LOC112190073 isoform X2 [Rosa chinensis]XP_040369688.1 uncharacterized protein LOC112190073 isoform X2 [Rosa chinensis]XP_040369689.1 uncharacterized protein LOC112190073 isoform X2 [Rosa chinensis]XP_040369690.1 uncharacterized protein LOC112190073 isoform X2 [Rosa chinensis]XP_040369691.1 uncharacterized protein LOC112190073 isoform X2 [Rosa chinensis]
MSNYNMDFQLDDDALPSMHESVQFDDSETQDVGRLFVNEQTIPTENRNNAANEGNKKKGRGKTVIKWGQRGVRERVKWGKQGVPVSPREKCAQYSLFIGSLAADPGLYPIDVKDWRHFDKDDNHQRAWTCIEGTIDWTDEAAAAKKSEIKKYAFEKLADRWKHHKSELKKLYWLPNQGTEERFCRPDNAIDRDQWIRFVTHLDDEDTKTKAAINVSNRSQRVMHHSTSTRTFPAVVYEWQVENRVEEEPDRLEIFKLTHRKKGKQNEYVDAASTKAVQDLEKAEEERKKLNVDITPQVREDIYAQVLGPEKRNRVRGLGAGVRWRDVPYLHTEKRSISATMEAMKATIEEQRLETARLRSEAEKERQEAAQREERNRIESAEMNKRFAAQMEEFKKQQEAAMEENARKVNELARLQGIRWMKEAGFSGIETAPQLDSDPMTQLAAVQPQCNRPAIPTPPIEDVYRPEMPQTVQESQLN